MVVAEGGVAAAGDGVEGFAVVGVAGAGEDAGAAACLWGLGTAAGVAGGDAAGGVA
jgi:hypothetical protein